MEVRNLSAVMHNLGSRLGMQSSPCKLIEKWESVKLAAQIELACDAPEVLRSLLATARRVAKVTTWNELYALQSEIKAAAAAVRELSDAHFADRKHSHGTP